ncbi:RNA-binding S4 domain-containing protein [Conexibacter sp. W3-3-2]|uniref:RNA-binding S4 domain-containing protein n=1 Tax=Conexibacter sp. W3-3-2 TaxID=2675227 RepID=UPI001325AFFC|nr:RNA-binding S4 domain-containing protein [Conexibacter sp. W3-3-2]MTD43916.1 RNA-binding S4 domain-containing protein [Conexibacter sp. W3-3-2]
MTPERVRIDQWLWAARFAKTRALANEAAGGGRVKINGATVKPSREVLVGDTVEVVTGPVRKTVVVREVVRRRVSAAVAATLYEETPESIAAREEAAAVRRLAEPLRFEGGGRPTKRDRRRFEAEREARRSRDLE